MNKDRALAGVGLLAFGGSSIYANVTSVHLPHLAGDWTTKNIAAWQAIPMVDATGSDIFWAVFFPVAALMGIEFVARWTNLHKGIRFGVLGLAAAVAVFASYKHIIYVLLWHGQGTVISLVGPIAVDALMILCTMQILSTRLDAPADTSPEVVRDVTPVLPLGFVPAHHLSLVPIGPVPAPVVQDTPRVPKSRVSPDTDKPAKDKAPRSSWDTAEAARLILSTDKSNHEIGDIVGVGYKSIQRLRRSIAEDMATMKGQA